ncbi:nucleotidyltransferase family protein [Aestuariicoccus sp. MJ-SS9]|uniref:nucleotidyltransferase domain-containing protein n=1 Tax=Aestuariicoccus sp. MJ-SS9 TaxID=3079855 RepID=UPI0029068A55|nr:nucleotidyltransferase family protein [Aestuariicoccus sp. MJ-SS9]MDU8913743.1 nucleotidyltransferase family protein [Aestuariicoccus sp. MJ-SS9]
MTRNPLPSSQNDVSRSAWQALLHLTGPSPQVPAQDFDWEWVIDLALRHKSVLLLARGIAALPSVSAPETARRRLAELSTTRALQCLMLARDTALVASHLRDAGVSASVMKGAPLSQVLHGDAAARDPGDVDFLVPADQVDQAASVLESRGFYSEFRGLLRSDRQRERVLRGTNQLAFFDPQSGRAVELHWRWQKFEGMMPTDAEKIWSRSIPIAGAGEVLVPDGIETFIYLCAHGLAHGWMRLKWLNDIRWVLHTGRLVDEDWVCVVDRARELGMSTAVGTAVLVAARIDDAQLPDPLDALIRRLPKCRDLSEQSIQWMLKTAILREDPPPPRGALAIARGIMRHMDISIEDQPRALSTRMRALLAPSLPELALVDLPRGLEAGYLFVRAARMLGRMLPATTDRR